MRLTKTSWLGLSVLLALLPIMGHSQAPIGGAEIAASAGLSPGAAAVVKLAESGVSDDVVMAYIQNSQAPFGLTADNIVYLKDNGLSPAAVTAMLDHDKSFPGSPPQYTYDQKLYPATIAPPSAQLVPQPVLQGQPVEPQPTSVPTSSSPPPAYVSDAPPQVGYFYNQLSPYGAWVNLDGYGWCWQPRTVIVNRQWRPYCDGGHWVYSEAGWFWQSDYSWGWAPFHYGRWQLHPRVGWVWFPDTVWGPAWVVWRSGGDNCGWAPLPLHATFDVRSGLYFNGVRVGANFDFGLGVNVFTFIALRDFNRHDLPHRCLLPAQVTTVYRNTRIINNYTVNNNIVINHGIPVERVAAVTHAQFRPVAVRSVTSGTEIRGGTTPVVYRQELRAPVSKAPIVAQKVDDRHPVVQHAELATVNNPRNFVPANGGMHGNAAGPATVQPANLRSMPAPSRGEPSLPHNQAQTPSPLTTRQTVPTSPVAAREESSKQTSKATGTPEVENNNTAARIQNQAPPPAAPVSPKQSAAPASAMVHNGNTVTTGGSAPHQPGQSVSTTPSPHYYPPKSARQAAEAHVVPPEPLPVVTRTAPPRTDEGQAAYTTPVLTSPRDNSKHQ